jgi:hypothetical protein
LTLESTIAAALVSGGFGTALGTDIFVDMMPVTPLGGCLIIPLAGREPDEEQGGDGVDYPGLQIQVRGVDPVAAKAKAEAIRLAFTKLTAGDYTLSATRSYPTNLTGPTDLKAGVYRFSIDFETIKIR